MQTLFRNNAINNSYFLKIRNLFDFYEAFEEFKKALIFRVRDNS